MGNTGLITMSMREPAMHRDARWHQQTRRRVSAHAADSRREIGHLELEAFAGAVETDAVPASNERRCCCTRKQDGANNLGTAGP